MSALTKREYAESVFVAANSMSTGRVFGATAEHMKEIYAERVSFCDKAIAVIDDAIGSDHAVLLREPSDARLVQMKTVLIAKRKRLTDIQAANAEAEIAKHRKQISELEKSINAPHY